jgi:hypothetical protein
VSSNSIGGGYGLPNTNIVTRKCDYASYASNPPSQYQGKNDNAINDRQIVDLRISCDEETICSTPAKKKTKYSKLDQLQCVAPTSIKSADLCHIRMKTDLCDVSSKYILLVIERWPTNPDVKSVGSGKHEKLSKIRWNERDIMELHCIVPPREGELQGYLLESAAEVHYEERASVVFEAIAGTNIVLFLIL